ncbi:MAG TPA: PRTRC system protein E [Candidatus Binatia bacterium]|nr:PRTRC system protein E [Candidatus Binatia bacterium]
MFVELIPLLKQRTLLITVARLDEKLKVNVIPAKLRDGEDQALTTPLTYTGSPEELDAELGKHLASYVDSHLALGSTLTEAKAEMDAAAKAARQKVKTTQQASKIETAVTNKREAATPIPSAAETMPNLFAEQSQSTEPTAPSAEEAGRTS